jgi:hypothetical protein
MPPPIHPVLGLKLQPKLPVPVGVLTVALEDELNNQFTPPSAPT